MKAYTTYSTRVTPQSESIPGKDMIENNAGGFVFAVDDWKRLDRFLILGSEGGSYYVNEQKLTKENAEAVLHCIQTDGIRTVNRIVEISDSGRAPKNDPALFALAMCTGLGNEETKEFALSNLSKVARIGTHLFHFSQYVEQFRGWGRCLSNAVKDWYNSKSLDELAYQAIKYQSRDGWSHRDLLRLSHPKTDDPKRNAIYKWIVDAEVIEELHESIIAFESAKRVQTAKEIIDLIIKHDLPRECVPTQFLNMPSVWEALFEKMPMTAMIRNLGKMSRVGLLKPMSEASFKVAEKLVNIEFLKKARIHPLAILIALRTYAQGKGYKGSLTWTPVPQIVDALNEAFYFAFQNIEPTGKRWFLALDVSGSMTSSLSGTVLSCREAAAAMAMVTVRTEPKYFVGAFYIQFNNFSISKNCRLDEVTQRAYNADFGGTDCALPMIYALKNRIEADVFVVYTDSETWAGNIHPCQALQEYRQKMSIPAKLIVVGMVSNGFTIADPDDGGMLDVVGFDSAVPEIMNDFVKTV